MRRHAAQQSSTRVAHIHIQGAYAGGHAERLGDIKALFGIVAALGSDTVDGASICRNALYLGSPFLFGVLVVGGDVGDVKSGKLQQADGLALAGKLRSSVISCSHVAAAEG